MADNDKYTKEQLSRFKAIENITGVSKEYFDSIFEACAKIGEFAKKLRRNFEFLDNLQKSTYFAEWELSDRINHCLCLDAIRCFEGMGISIDPDNKEFYGLFLFISHIVSEDFLLEYESVLKHEAVIQGQINYYVALKNFSESIWSDKSLLIPKLLSEENDLLHRYRVLVYRWASLVAKADNIITEREQEWLTSMMSPSHDNKQTRNYDGAKDADEVQIAEESILESPIEKLKGMIGLSSVKQEIETLYNFVRIQLQRKRMGMKISSVSYHCVFTGNAGTGKTSVARIVAEIYKELGILKKGHLVETDRSGLVAEYVGQTAIKTNKIIDSALDGVLFIDEAYALSEGGKEDFGKEAISTLIKRMEDDRNRLVVILAGYSQNMKLFMDSNAGLQSRFNRNINFPDFSESELYDIFISMADKYEYKLTPAAQTKLKKVIQNVVGMGDPKFGNGRFVRNLFEKTIEHQANRLVSVSEITPEILSSITEVDINH